MVFYSRSDYFDYNKNLAKSLIYYLDQPAIKLQMQHFYGEGIKEKWGEIRNYKILLETIKNLKKYLDNPTQKRLRYVEWLASEFNYSEDLIVLDELLGIFRLTLRDKKLVESLLPMTLELERSDCSETYLDFYYDTD